MKSSILTFIASGRRSRAMVYGVMCLLALINVCVACTLNGGSDKEQAAQYFEQALGSFAHHDYKGAISPLTTAIELDQSTADYFEFRGISYYHNQDYEHAINDFDQSIALRSKENPSGAPGLQSWADDYGYLGSIYIAKADYSQAITNLSQAISLSGALDYYKVRGDAYETAGQKDLAIADYKTVLNLDGRPTRFETTTLGSSKRQEIEQKLKALGVG